MLKSWLKVYWNNSKKHKVYFLLTILCLAIGITAVLLSGLYFKEVHAFDQWNDKKEEIYLVSTKGETSVDLHHPFILSRLIEEHCRSVEGYLTYNGYSPEDITYKEKTVEVEKIMQSNKPFFEFFPYSFIYGSSSTIFQNPNEVVFEKQKAELFFGVNNNPIGELVQMDGKNYTVVGVYDLEDKRSNFMPDVVVNDFQFLTEDQLTDWNYLGSSLLIKTNKKEDTRLAIDQLYMQYFLIPTAQKEGVSLEEFLERSGGYYNRKAELHALDVLHIEPQNEIEVPEPKVDSKFVYVIVGLSWVILILSLFNYVNLSLSQALFRAKEVGIRKALGGLERSIIKQSLFETAITLSVSSVLSVFMLLWILPFANSVLETNIVVQLQDFLVLFIGISMFVFLLTGLIPACYVARYKTLKALKGSYHRSRSGSIVKNSFLIVQFAIASWFITGTYIVYKQFNYMTTKELGFKGDQVINFPFLENEYGGDKQSKYDAFKTEALKIKGVEQIAITDLDYGKKNLGGYGIHFAHEDKHLLVHVSNIEVGYFEMMGIQLKEGRFLDSTLANDSINNALINESLLALIEKETIDDLVLGNRNIVGLVRDFHFTGLDEAISPMMFLLPSEQYNNYRSVSMKIDAKQLETLIPSLEVLWLTFNSETKKPFEFQFVNQLFARSFEKIQTQKQVMLYLSYIVVFIALFGLFAVSSFNVGTKLREIAIRKVLGADTTSLIRNLSYQYLIYCIIGFGLSVFPSYYLLKEWLASYAYRIEIGYEVYGVCLVLIVALTLLIVVSRAYKATRVNVLDYIKYE